MPKRNLIVLASTIIETHHTNAIDNETHKNYEVIHWIEKDQGV